MFTQQTQCSASGRITRLDMDSQILPETRGIPLALLDLTGLTYLDVANNALPVTLPAELVRLTGP